MRFDYCIIGAGIVGLATAKALLAARPGASIVILEKENGLGRHQTGRNSGVIHTGIYYAPNSLKAQLCREGAQRTKEFCQNHDIPFENRGKLIVATQAEELPRLEALYARSKENKIHTSWLTAEALKEREPNIAGLAAIDVPDAAIVNYGRILDTLAQELSTQNVDIRFGATPLAITETGDEVQITLPSETLRAAKLVACAGLQSDRIARLAGLSLEHRIVPFRGEYFRLAPRCNSIVQAMIYPVPQPGLPFLGTHLTPMIDGFVTVGPNAILGLAREGYKKRSINPRDMADYLGFAGFWRCMAANVKPGMAELRNALFKSQYLAECQKYCPDLTREDLLQMPTGIRAQAIMADGSLQHDFLFLNTPRMLHVCNAPSPAATSALPIGEMIAKNLLT